MKTNRNKAVFLEINNVTEIEDNQLTAISGGSGHIHFEIFGYGFCFWWN